MVVFCDRLKLCSTAALDCRTGQKKGRYLKKELSFLLISLSLPMLKQPDACWKTFKKTLGKKPKSLVFTAIWSFWQKPSVAGCSCWVFSGSPAVPSIDGQGSFVSWTFNVSYKALHKTSLEGLWQQLSRCSTDAHWAKESQFSPTNVKKKCIWHTHSQQCWRPFWMVVTLPAGKKRNTMGTNYFWRIYIPVGWNDYARIRKLKGYFFFRGRTVAFYLLCNF